MILSQNRTRKLADRTPKVVARNANVPEVVNIGTKVVPLAGAYVAAHEALK